MGWPKQTAFVASGVCVLVAAGPATGQTRPQAKSATLQVHFSLQVGNDAPVKGRLMLGRAGQTCVEVDQPVAQRMWLDAKGAEVYYPLTQELFRQRTSDRALPAFFDAVMAGLADPTAHLPQGARLLTRTHDADSVTSTWRVADRDERSVQHLQIRENRAGVQDVTLRSEKGQTLRHYQFGPRTKSGKLQVPSTITASYHASKRQQARVERWQLRDPAPLAAVALTAQTCLKPAAGVKVSAW